MIRPEQKEDFSAIGQVNRLAFGTDAEANLVNALRKSNTDIISLVAECDDKIVGHILFSEVHIDGHCPDIRLLGLAPVGVLPEYQGHGIGSRLVKEGIKVCRHAGYAAMVVLGHAQFYPRFGFKPSVNFNITSEFDHAAAHDYKRCLLEIPSSCMTWVAVSSMDLPAEETMGILCFI
jgi:putative acetyltransferase